MLPRHEQVWLSAAGWAAARAQVSAVHHAAIDQWQAADWPLIARRHEADCPLDWTCLGLSLPPQGIDKIRAALRLPKHYIKSHLPPLAIAALSMPLRADWRVALDALQLAVARQQLTVQVVGSAALQAITGLPYLQSGSDLDLLLQPTSLAQLDDGIDLLRQHADRLPLDGEVIFPNGDAVAWKEWCIADKSNARVLAKNVMRVALLQRDVLLQTLSPHVCLS